MFLPKLLILIIERMAAGNALLFSITLFTAALNDILTELALDSAARANHCEIPSPLSCSDTGPASNGVKGEARFIKSAKRIAPSSSSFGGNKEQWAVIQL